MTNWKEGDYGYTMRFIFLNPLGVPINITNGSVIVRCKLGGKLRKYNGTIEDGANGVAILVLPEGLLSQSGKLQAQAQAITDDGKFTSDIIEEDIDELLGSA